MEEEHKHHHEDVHEDEEPKWKGPIKVILGLFLLLLIILWLVPYYSVQLNPEPKDIPTISEINSQLLVGVEIGNETGITSIREAKLDYENPFVKQVATKIATESCDESRICHVKALYYFVRDNVEYVSDPYEKEYIASPVETLKTEGGDCDDGALLLASMIKSIGVNAEIVVVPGHAFIRASLPEASPKYKINEWTYMDWTCKDCKFGEIPYKNTLQIRG